MSSRAIHRDASAHASLEDSEAQDQAPGLLQAGDVGAGPQPLVLQTMRRLLRDIFSGVYGPGDRIREVEVAERLGISRAPVREALRILEQDGLVEIAPFRGARVVSLQNEQIADLFDLLGTLLGAVARFAVRHASESDLQHHSAQVAKYEVWTTQGRDFGKLVDLGYQIGTDLGACCGNPLAADMLRKLGRRAYVLHRFLKPVPARWQQQTITRYRRLDAALRARSEVRAERAARRLVQHTLSLVLRHAVADARRDPSTSFERA